MIEALGEAFGATRGADSAIGPFIRVEGMVLVPVLALEAALLQHRTGESSGPAGAAGAAQLELMGFWIAAAGAKDGRGPAHPRRERSLRPWLPAREEPPPGAASWSSWLAARPALLREIRTALEAAGACGAGGPG
jgi:hypothetical protein